MKISRYGSTAFHSVSTIELDSPNFSWDSKTMCITVKQSKIKDFSSKSNHDYTISLSLNDVQKLLAALSEGASSEPAIFEKNLESSLKSLTRLQAIIAGIVPNQKPND